MCEMIRIEHLKKAYTGVTPLKDVSVTVNRGDVISVIGPSGTGKSTLLRCINMLEVPTSGKIIIDGQDITQKGFRIEKVRRKMGMVFQGFNLFEHLTVIENLMLAPVDLLGKSRQEAYDRGMELLDKVGLGDRALQYPAQLSGGQKQRVAIARALAMDPEIMLFDEPTSALDPTMVGEVQRVIRDLAKQGLTMMIVTHEMRFAREVANRVFYMDRGGIYEDGTPEQIFDHPQKERTRRFIRRLKVFETDIDTDGQDLHSLYTAMEGFGLQNQVSGSVMRKLHAVFEELVFRILLPARTAGKIRFAAEYADETDEMTVILLYDGPAFDPADTQDLLAWKLISGYSENYSRTAINEDGFTNRVTLTIR